MGEIAKEIRKIRKEKIAILTNASIIDRKDVQEDLKLMDFVIAKLDAHSQRLFSKINKPAKTIKFNKIVKGLKKFKSRYRGKFAIQAMFINENKDYAEEIATLVREINPDEVQLNTPLRPCKTRPLTKRETEGIKKFFEGTNYISVYNGKKKKVRPLGKKNVLRRRGIL